jgi:UDP-GlcNAc:undecaprenyl-phosphate GlcNAc-1-phosphate transferase
MDWRLFTTVLFATAAIAVVLVPPSRYLARRFGVIDHPGDRKVHREPMPRLGGLAVYGAFTSVVLVGYLLIPVLEESEWAQSAFGAGVVFLAEAGRVEGRLMALLLGGTIVFGVGLLDDCLGPRFPTWAKAAGQLVAAAVLVFGGEVRTTFLPTQWLNELLTLAWLVGITNAFNLLDNMDGLSAGVAAVASSILLLNAWLLEEHFITLIFAAFLGSVAGFLVFNFNPAKVFLGDGGSLFVGYTMASLTLLERYVSHASSTLFPVLMPVVVLAVPIVDTATVVWIRLREGRPIYVGDARHLSHQLVRLGFSQRTTVLIIYLVTFSLGIGALFLVDASPARSAVILAQIASVIALLLVLMFGAEGNGASA